MAARTEIPAGVAGSPVPPPVRDPTGCGPVGGGDEALGLAMSGGGFRATLFHVGALRRLNESGLLGRLDRISSVSGGSFAAGVLALAWSRFSYDPDGRVTNFQELVADPLIAFCQRRLDVFVIAAGLVPFVNPADVLARILDGALCHGATLQALPDRPRFVFNASHLATGVSWRFEKPYMGDYRVGLVCDPDVPVARAMTASASFPPFVAPLVLRLREGALRKADGADLFDDPRTQALKRRVLLMDGGAYDNLGLETVEGRCRTVLASDAGGDLKVDAGHFRYRFWWPLLRRTIDVSLDQGRAQRRRTFVGGATATRALRAAGVPTDAVTEHAVLWRTSQRIRPFERLLPPGWTVDPRWAAYMATRPARIWRLPERDWKRLVNWGYLTSDLVLRSYLPELKGSPPPVALPYPEFDFSAAPPG